MKRVLTAAFALTLFSTPIWAAIRTTTLKVPGMTCPTCPITVKKALQKVSGVSTIDVNYPRKEVVVTFDDAKTSTQALMKATADAGYPSQSLPWSR